MDPFFFSMWPLFLLWWCVGVGYSGGGAAGWCGEETRWLLLTAFSAGGFSGCLPQQDAQHHDRRRPGGLHRGAAFRDQSRQAEVAGEEQEVQTRHHAVTCFPLATRPNLFGALPRLLGPETALSSRSDVLPSFCPRTQGSPSVLARKAYPGSKPTPRRQVSFLSLLAEDENGWFAYPTSFSAGLLHVAILLYIFREMIHGLRIPFSALLFSFGSERCGWPRGGGGNT